MNNFNWTKAIGYGVVIWAVMAIALWALGSVQSLNPLWAHGLVAVVGALVTYILIANAKPESGAQAAGYGLIFATVIVAFDLILTQWFDAHIFSAWQYWLGPALVFLTPWTRVESRVSLIHPV